MSRNGISKEHLKELVHMYNSDHNQIRSRDEAFLNGEDKKMYEFWFDSFKERDRKTFERKPFVKYAVPKMNRGNFINAFEKYVRKGPLYMPTIEGKELNFLSTAYFVPNFIAMMTRIRKRNLANYRYVLKDIRPDTFVHTGLNVSEEVGNVLVGPFQMQAFQGCLEAKYDRKLSPLKVLTDDYKWFPISVGATPLLEARVDQIVNHLVSGYYVRHGKEDYDEDWLEDE